MDFISYDGFGRKGYIDKNRNFKDQTDQTRISRTKLIANPNLDGLECMLAIGFYYLPPTGLDLDSAYCSF
jgi:hypothetical protein